MDPKTTAAILNYQLENCGERLDPERTEGYSSDLSPYPGYVFCRLVLGRQRIVTTKAGESERRDVYEGTESTLLVRFDAENCPDEVIPLDFKSGTIYALNKIMRLHLRKEDVVRYLVFFGANLKSDSNSKFYFLEFIDQLNCLDESPEPQLIADLTAAVRSNFKVGSDGKIVIDVAEKRYPLLGTAYRLKLPVIYEGGLFKAKCVVSAAGVPEMKEDDPTTLTEIDAGMITAPTHVLQSASRVSARIQAKITSANLLVKSFGAITRVAKLLMFMVLPAYLLTFAISFQLGFNNRALHSYYEAVKESWILTWICLAFGMLFVVAILMRFVIIELANFMERFIPNDFTQMLSGMKEATSQIRKTTGLPLFILSNALDVFIESLIALNLFLYGVVQVFMGGDAGYDLNFLEVFAMIVMSVPLVGPSLGWVLNVESAIGLYDISRSPGLMYFSSFVISTVATGLLLRAVMFSKKEETSIV